MKATDQTNGGTGGKAVTYTIPPGMLPELRALHAAWQGAQSAAQAAQQAAEALGQRYSDKLGTVYQVRGIKPDPTTNVTINLDKGTVAVGGGAD